MDKEVKLEKIPIDSITSTSLNPRNVHRAKKGIDSLVKTIRKSGVLQPIKVRPQGDHYELVYGLRRYLAAKEATLEKIPAQIAELSDFDAAKESFYENNQRKDLNPLERAEHFKVMLQLQQSPNKKRLAKELDVNRTVLQRYFKILDLPDEIKKLVTEEKIKEREAYELALLGENPDLQRKVAREVANDKVTAAGVKKRAKQLKAETDQNNSPSVSPSEELSKVFKDLPDFYLDLLRTTKNGKYMKLVSEDNKDIQINLQGVQGDEDAEKKFQKVKKLAQTILERYNQFEGDSKDKSVHGVKGLSKVGSK